MQNAKFDYARHIDLRTGEKIEEVFGKEIQAPRLWNSVDDIRFPLAGTRLGEQEVLLVEHTTGKVWVVSLSELPKNNIEYPVFI